MVRGQPTLGAMLPLWQQQSEMIALLMQTPIAAYLHHIPELSIPMIPIIMTHSMIAKDTGVVSQALACADAQPHRSKSQIAAHIEGLPVYAALCCAVPCCAVLR